MPSLTQLEYIIAVDKYKHFGRAAQACSVAQPSLSAQIQKVEESLGAIIFDRSKKPIITTDKGKEIVAQAKIVIREQKRIFDIASESSEIKGDFHLGVIPTLSAYIIPLFIESFSKNYPKVNVKISEHKTEDIISKLYDDELDAGLLVTPLYDDKIIEQSLFFEPFYAFVSDNHSLFNKSDIKASELDEESIWLLNEGHCFRDQVIRLCDLKSDSHVLSNVSFESGNLETLKNLIRGGRGYTLLPYLATLNLTKSEISKNLKTFTSPVPTREVSLVHSRAFLKEDIIKVLIDEILKNTPKALKSVKRGDIKVVDI